MSAFNLALPTSSGPSTNASAGPSRAPTASRPPSPTPSASSSPEPEQEADDAEPVAGPSQHELSRALYSSKKETVMYLYQEMDDAQKDRFQAYQTATINKQHIRRVVHSLTGQPIAVNFSALVAGVTKVYVAELVELAKDIQARSAMPLGPLRPQHLREADRRMRAKGLPGRDVRGFGGIGGGAGGGRRSGRVRPLFKS